MKVLKEVCTCIIHVRTFKFFDIHDIIENSLAFENKSKQAKHMASVNIRPFVNYMFGFFDDMPA